MSDAQAWVGARHPRKEDRRLTTGKGQYIGDLHLPNMLHVVFVRSDRAHARILRIDTRSAAALPGVVAVVTGEMIRGEINPLPQPSVTPNLTAQNPRFWPLAVGKVKFHGEPVAAVVARDKYLAEDAAEAVEVEYADLPYVGDPQLALEDGSPLVHEEFTSNESFRLTYGGGRSPEAQKENLAAVGEAIRTAPHTVTQRFYVHRCGTMPLEPRGAVATWDDGDGLHAWITTQRPHGDRLGMAEALGLPKEKVRVIAPRDQGGGFGVKAPFYREPILVCYLARKLKRPVRWIETREEHLMTVSQERDQVHDLELAADADGRILAVRDRILGDAGDGCEGFYWGWVMPFLGGLRLPSAYDVPVCDVSVRVAFTNKAVLSPARGIGIFPSRFAMDRAVDMLAHRLGKEPAAVRRLNMIASLPHTTATGLYYDSGDYRKTWDRLVQLADIPVFRAEQARARAQGRFIGLGFGVGVEPSGVSSERYVQFTGQPGYGAATVRIDPAGKVMVLNGDAPQGQGHETTCAQVVAQEFGISPDDTVLMLGDTGTTPYGSGTVASRAASYSLSSVAEGCRHLKKKIGRILAHDLKLDAGEDDFDFTGGEIVYRRDTTIRRDFRETCHRIVLAPLNLPSGESGGLEHTAYFESPVSMSTFGAHAAFVEVDAGTGKVRVTRYITSDDVGTVINPRIVEGQVHGGVVQGISNALFEEFVYDENGQQLTSNLENYKIATAADVPAIESYHDAGTPCEHTPLGARGVGEGCIAPVAGAVANAVSDALRPLGIEITSLPIRPKDLWRAMNAALNRTGNQA
jgi:carbon-monoxide dehydrogenase large subunit